MTKLIALMVIVGFIFTLYKINRKRKSYAEAKKEYANSHGKEIIFGDVFSEFPESIIFKNEMTSPNFLWINDVCSWQDARVSFVSAGGKHDYIYDTLLIRDVESIELQYINRKIKLRYPKENQASEEAKRIYLFLDDADLSMDAGKWGVVLIKNQGCFDPFSVDKLVENFYSILKKRS